MAELTPENDFQIQKFAGSGETLEEKNERESHLVPTSATPIGIKTPLTNGYEDGLFVMTKDYGAQIADNFRNLIQTNHGERLGLYDFGANLQPLLLDNADDFENRAMSAISQAVSKYMPFIRLEGFASFPVEEDSSQQSLGIKISYSIPGIDSSSRVLELVMKVGL